MSYLKQNKCKIKNIFTVILTLYICNFVAAASKSVESIQLNKVYVLSGIKDQMIAVHDGILQLVNSSTANMPKFLRNSASKRYSKILNFDDASEFAKSFIQDNINLGAYNSIIEWYSSESGKKIVSVETQAILSSELSKRKTHKNEVFCEAELNELIAVAGGADRVLRANFIYTKMSEAFNGKLFRKDKNFKVKKQYYNFYQLNLAKTKEESSRIYKTVYSDLECFQIVNYIQFLKSDTGKHMVDVFSDMKIETIKFLFGRICRSILLPWNANKCSTQLEMLNEI